MAKIGRPSKIAALAAARGIGEVAMMNELLAKHLTYEGVAAELGVDIAAVSRWCSARGATKRVVITIPLVIDQPAPRKETAS